MSRIGFTSPSTSIYTIMNQITAVKFGGLDLQPPYQRSYIWKPDFKNKLVLSVIKNYPIGSIVIRDREDINLKGAKKEVVDGQQRLTTIKDFMHDKLVVRGISALHIIEEIIDYMSRDINSLSEKDRKKLELLEKKSLMKSPSIKFSNLPKIIHDNINGFQLSTVEITRADDATIQQYFRFLQNQERLKAGEIINALPETDLDEYINEIENKNLFLDLLGFNDTRREFDKIYYSIIGLFDSKLQFGTTDKQIQTYVIDEKVLTKGLKYCKNINEQINWITENIKNYKFYFNKRLLKYILLLMGTNFVDFKIDTLNKFKRLDVINQKLSAFSSAIKDAENKVFTKDGYSDEVVEELRLIALLVKGGHSLKRAVNRAEMLAYYINNDNHKTKTSGVKQV